MILMALVLILSSCSQEEKQELKSVVALINFSDYKFEEIDRREEDLINKYSGKDYNKSLYQSMFFGEDYYKGSNGDDYMTLRKYYRDLSGGNLDITGSVYGFYQGREEASYYGANVNGLYSDQKSAVDLVIEACENLAEDKSLDLANFAKNGRNIDSLIVIHPGIGEEWGGGSLGEEAIWPFRGKISWFENLDYSHLKIKDYRGKEYIFDDFIIVSQDLAPSLIAHEYGHILGLPDLYGFEGSTPPTEYWSLMSSSYAGKDVFGSIYIDMGAYCRYKLGDYQDMEGFYNLREIDYRELNKALELELRESNQRSGAIDLVKINMEPRKHREKTPSSGEYMYVSHGGRDNNHMSLDLDLRGIVDLELEMDLSLHLKEDYDSLSLVIEDLRTGEKEALESREGQAMIKKLSLFDLYGEKVEMQKAIKAFTGMKPKWTKYSFDLDNYSGRRVRIHFYHSALEENPVYIDNICLKSEGQEVLVFDAEEDKKEVDLGDFEISDGRTEEESYYLLEWRNPRKGSIDEGLGYINKNRKGFSYDPGLVIWYVNERFDDYGRIDQNVSVYTGKPSVGVVDSDQNPPLVIQKGQEEKDKSAVTNMADAAFGLGVQDYYKIKLGDGLVEDRHLYKNPYFNSGLDYSNSHSPMLGMKLDAKDLRINIVEQDRNNSYGKLVISRDHLEKKGQEIQLKSIDFIADELVVDLGKKPRGQYYIGLINKEGHSLRLALEIIGDKLVLNTANSEYLKASYDIDYIVLLEDSYRTIYNKKFHPIGQDLEIKNKSK